MTNASYEFHIIFAITQVNDYHQVVYRTIITNKTIIGLGHP